VSVHLPKDRVTGLNQSFGFVEFMTEEDADYAIRVLNMVKLHGKVLRVNKAASDKKSADGQGGDAFAANLFIGNLHPDVDEKTLYDTFSAFGIIVQTPKVHTHTHTLSERVCTSMPVCVQTHVGVDARVCAYVWVYLCVCA
jgi:splicing factor 3B subunit 4